MVVDAVVVVFVVMVVAVNGYLSSCRFSLLTEYVCFQGRFVDVVVVDRCGGYMRASDDKTCDPNGKTFAEGGNCIKVRLLPYQHHQKYLPLTQSTNKLINLFIVH